MFFGMSQEQVEGQLRQILPIVGTVLVSLGLMKPETVGNWTAFILVTVGPVMIIASAVWSLIDKTRASMIKKVDKIAQDPTSPVLGIITTNNAEGIALANSLPGATTVPAGTLQAAEVAKV